LKKDVDFEVGCTCKTHAVYRKVVQYFRCKLPLKQVLLETNSYTGVTC